MVKWDILPNKSQLEELFSSETDFHAMKTHNVHKTMRQYRKEVQGYQHLKNCDKGIVVGNGYDWSGKMVLDKAKQIKW